MEYCLFFYKEQCEIGIVQAEKGAKVEILTQDSSFVVRQNQIVHIWEAEEASQPMAQYLANKKEEIHSASQNIDVNTIFELCEFQVEYSLEELITLFAGETEAPYYGAALFLALFNHSAFSYVKKSFLLKTEEEQAEERKKQEQKEEKQRKQGIEENWAKELIQGNKPHIAEEDITWFNSFCAQIHHFLVYGSKSSYSQYIVSLFNISPQLTAKTERYLLSILSLNQQACSWGVLQVLRTKAQCHFSQEVLEQVKAITTQDIWQTPYQVETKDCRDLEVYTVDNEKTKDYDDAFTFEIDGDLVKITVFITDVASFVLPNTPLFETASQSFSSLYTLKETYPMLPQALSDSFLSLCEKQDRAALAFETCLDLQGNIVKQSIFRAIIQVKENVSYTQFETWLIDPTNRFAKLYEICQQLLDKRINEGGLIFDRTEVELDITDVDRIKIKEPVEQTRAQAVIQELAILVNTQTGKALHDKGYKAFFRGQLPYSWIEGVEPSVNPSMQDIIFQPAYVALDPVKHAVLGVDSYVQSSSPLRRFLDLISQHTLFYMLENTQTKFTEEELLVYAEESQGVMRDYRRTEKVLTQHWKWKYLAQNQEQVYQIELVRKDRGANRYLVTLPLLDMKCDCYLTNIKQQSQKTYQAKITELDVIAERMTMEIVDEG